METKETYMIIMSSNVTNPNLVCSRPCIPNCTFVFGQEDYEVANSTSCKNYFYLSCDDNFGSESPVTVVLSGIWNMVWRKVYYIFFCYYKRTNKTIIKNL